MTGCIGGCDHGWVSVGANYGERTIPVPDHPGPDATPERIVEWQRAVDVIGARRRLAANTVYPCKVCDPFLFGRWAGGHLASDHDRSTCDECDGRRTASRPATPDTPERKDLL